MRVLCRVGVTGHTKGMMLAKNVRVIEQASLKCTSRGEGRTCLHHRKTCGSSEKRSGKHPSVSRTRTRLREPLRCVYRVWGKSMGPSAGAAPEWGGGSGQQGKPPCPAGNRVRREGRSAPEARALMAAAPEEVVKLLSRKPREMPSGVAKAKVAMTDQNCRVPASESTMLDPRAYAANPLCACAREKFVTLLSAASAAVLWHAAKVPCALACKWAHSWSPVP